MLNNLKELCMSVCDCESTTSIDVGSQTNLSIEVNFQVQNQPVWVVWCHLLTVVQVSWLSSL